jgi:ParB-like chromosome segregation protein Spo0J
MMEIRKIVIDENNQILGGNKRFFALKALGMVDIPDSWVDQVTGLTEAEKREFIVKDNSHWGSEWDFDFLR